MIQVQFDPTAGANGLFVVSDETAQLTICPCCSKPFTERAALTFRRNLADNNMTLADAVAYFDPNGKFN